MAPAQRAADTGTGQGPPSSRWPRHRRKEPAGPCAGNARTMHEARPEKRKTKEIDYLLLSLCLHPRSPICSLKLTHALLPEPAGSPSERVSCTEVQGPRKSGSIFCSSMVRNKRQCNESICAVGDSTPGLPFRVAGPPGRTPLNVGARTPCPKAKARAGSNIRHGLPRSTSTLPSYSAPLCQAPGRGPSASALAQWAR